MIIFVGRNHLVGISLPNLLIRGMFVYAYNLNYFDGRLFLNHLQHNCQYLLVNIKESFGKTNNVDRKSLIANSFRAGNDGNNKGNPSKGESSKGEPCKRGHTKEDPCKEGPSPCKKKKGEESAHVEEGKLSNSD